MNNNAEPSGIATQVRWWRDIPAKLISGLLLLTLAAGAAVWAIVAGQEEHLFFEQRIREAGITSSVMAEEFSERMLAGGGAAIWPALNIDARALQQKHLATRVLIFLPDGRIIAGSDKAAIGTRIETRSDQSPGKSSRPSCCPC